LSQFHAACGRWIVRAVVSITGDDKKHQEAWTMSVSNASKNQPREPDAAASSRAMAWMGGVFAFASLAALAVALVLEGPAADAVLADTPAAAAPKPR
jgi:hypothetical protein